MWRCFLCFFFQAEDGIRDDLVTGVQTCALPISLTVNQDPAIDAYGEVIINEAQRSSAAVPPSDPIVSCLTMTVLSTFMIAASFISAFPQKLRPRLPDFDVLLPNFAWLPLERIRDTLHATTQHYRATVHHPFRKHYKSRFPATSARRIDDWFSTDTMFFDVPAHDDGIPGHSGCKMLQLYAGNVSHFLSGFPMSSETQLPVTFREFIRKHGAPRGLFSDNAKSETSTMMKELHRYYLIDDGQSEPHYEHQNPVERRIQDVKRITNNVMDRVGCPSKFWLLCILFVISLLNVVVNANGAIPNSVISGVVTDVSPFLTFHFWEEVFYEEPDSSEKLGRWVGVASQGDVLTYQILTNDTQQVIVRSNVRRAKDPMFPNRRGSFPPDGGEVKSRPLLNSGSEC